MRRVRILALVLVMAVMLVGAAYALWNEDITLTTKATMGEMDVEVIGDPFVYALSCMPGIPGWVPGEDYIDPMEGEVITADRQTIRVTVGKLYPGAEYGLNFTIRNTGDVPFRLEDVNISCANNWDLFSKLSGAFCFMHQSANFDPQIITVGFSPLSDGTLADTIVTECAGVILYPGDELVGAWSYQDIGSTFMNFKVDSEISGDDFEKEQTSFDIDFIWEQCQPDYIPSFA